MNPDTIPLGLYIHLPFCIKRCPYCDFNAYALDGFDQGSGLFDAYIQRLLNDLEQQARQFSDTHERQLQTLFLGGGTPSLFSPEQLGRLMRGVRDIWPLNDDAEITLEANPGTAESGRFSGYRAQGINRLSLGVQSFSDQSLQRLGRVHNARAGHRAVELAIEADFPRLNLDIMFGLPEQTQQAALEDLDTALGYAPGHVSWYQLTLEPNTIFARFPPKLPSEAVMQHLTETGLARLQENHRRYEVSAFAQEGQTCQHNLNYWRFGDYLGIGAGAHGKLTLLDGSIVRYQRTRSPKDYLTSAAEPVEMRAVPPEQLPLEFLMNCLRLNEGATAGLFTDRTGLTLETIRSFIDEAESKGLLAIDALRATDLGYNHLDTLLTLV